MSIIGNGNHINQKQPPNPSVKLYFSRAEASAVVTAQQYYMKEVEMMAEETRGVETEKETLKKSSQHDRVDAGGGSSVGYLLTWSSMF